MRCPLAAKQARYLELARKVAEMRILAKDELAELIALRESLQKTAQERLERFHQNP
jgi:hypothetical protein